MRPPDRLTVSQAAEKYVKIRNPKSYSGPWLNSINPAMVEPMDALSSREYEAVIFSGPAQSGKTEALILNWMAYSVRCDPADMLIIEKTSRAAGDFSVRRIDRMHRNSPEVGSKLIARRDADNKFTKMYSNGCIVSLAHPSINELSGKPIPRCALTDYDRMPEDIDGEGSAFDQALKRNRTFGTFGMTLAESSTGAIIEDVKWMPRTPHEAPPCRGILSLYNRGDRRRLYWPCPWCREFFEPDFKLLKYPLSKDKVEAGELAVMECPHCSFRIHHTFRAHMREKNVWLRDGERIDQNRVITGDAHRSRIASFWMKGPAAEFTTWANLVTTYLQGLEEFERTGSEHALQVTVNQDQGEPYRPINMESYRLPEEIKSRAIHWEPKQVPRGVRFLMGLIDVQKNMFVVQVIGVGRGGDMWLVDRFKIKQSKRKDEEDPTQYLWVKPNSYIEDWELINEQLLQASYELEDGSGRRMSLMYVGVDTGGKSGVTTKAYEYWRKLRDRGDPNRNRFCLIKGTGLPGAPRQEIVFPDSGTGKGQTAGARGEIPVLMLNVNTLKDQLNGMLDRKDAFGGRIVFGDWTDNEVFVELCVERRTPKGWENPMNYRNEAWDLFTYAVGLCAYLKVDHIPWDNPPGYAGEWDVNSLVFKPAVETGKFVPVKKSGYDLAQLASELG